MNSPRKMKKTLLGTYVGKLRRLRGIWCATEVGDEYNNHNLMTLIDEIYEHPKT